MNEVTFFRGPEFVGKTVVTGAALVRYVGGTGADIEYKRCTADYSSAAERKYLVTGTRRRYKTLEAAAAAVTKQRMPTEEQFLAAIGPCGK